MVRLVGPVTSLVRWGELGVRTESWRPKQKEKDIYIKINVGRVSSDFL